ncbi:MAG: tRNA (guanosine(46)-N7)-methyltransferase TrmB [Verrucomicrobiae bacterium]|nr:tRNA (guanosine(46)-N7)-methyltransferase TrmB [Verrucomicrobiae bacterium]
MNNSRPLALSERAETFFHRPRSWIARLDWATVFGSAAAIPARVEVDLGAGDGGFVAERARRHPACAFLAVERLLGRTRKIARRAARLDLANVRVLRIEASYAVERLLPPHSVDAITVLFPDPWPKRRHHKNRLLQTSLLDACARALKPNGWIAIKTDDSAYFAHIRAAAAASPLLQLWNDATAETLLPEITDFERDFLKEGRPIHFLALRPRERAACAASVPGASSPRC